MSESQPSQLPASASGSGGEVGQARPEDLSVETVAVLDQGAGAEPTMAPPAAAGVGVGEAATTWINNQKVNALWGMNQNRNSWIGIAGVGWKKLANNSDSAVVALTILGANAKQMQTPVNYREEADGMVHEMYVW